MKTWLTLASALGFGLVPAEFPALASADTAICAAGRRQSPIDIVGALKQELPAIQFQYRVAPLRIVNDGHTVRVRFANGSRIILGNDYYTLQQLHFHLPGGDRIQGEEFAMAVHFVHKSSTGRLAVVVASFREGAASPALASLLPNMPARQGNERLLSTVKVDGARFLPVANGYFRYDGSLTAPPCTEGVTWLVLNQVQELSRDQLAQLRSRIPDNARPVQPLHGRLIRESS